MHGERFDALVRALSRRQLVTGLATALLATVAGSFRRPAPVEAQSLIEYALVQALIAMHLTQCNFGDPVPADAPCASLECDADTHLFEVQPREGNECRAATGACEMPATCTATSLLCPANVVKRQGTVCGTAAGPCEQLATCDGASAGCPDNEPLSNTPCGTNGTCQAGECIEPEGCPSGFADCAGDGTCSTDLMKSARHCGRCGDPCGRHEVCRNGACVLNRGRTRVGAEQRKRERARRASEKKARGRK